ncbi:PKD domain-containing protein [Luteolibacter soli]|uniref:PKD domain-containing protein n=1 Tax=Luteolibacter soli TaxID=3135280 RepID=UPI00311A752A
MVSKSPPQLNQGRVKGSVRVMTGGNFNINSGLTVDGSLLIPGTPEIRINGGATSPPVQDSTGSSQPSNYRLTLNNGISLGGITRRVDGEPLPTAAPPLAGTGTRAVNINQQGESAGNFATIRTLTLNAQGSSINLPPGRYERITLNGASTLVLQPGSTASPALYEIQQLDLNSGSHIDVSGPTELRLKNSLNANGYLGHPSHPEWLALSISAGSFTLNSQSAFHGKLVVPTGTLTVNGSSLLHGMAFTDRLTLNGGGIIECEGSGTTPNLPPVATATEATTPVGASIAIPLIATDPEGQALSYTVTTPPGHGTVTISGATATYTPSFNFVGSDIFYFNASDGTTDSAPASVIIHVWQPNRPPSAEDATFLLNQGEANAPLTLTATDPDGDALTYQILSQPQHGALGGSAPALTYAHTGPRSTAVIEDTFTFRVIDTQGAASTVGTITLQLQPANRAPQAAGLAVTTSEDLPVALSLSATDADGDSLTYALHLPQGFPGTITGTAPTLEFTPSANFHGTTAFTYDVTDPSGATSSAQVGITVTPVNDPPVIAAAISVTGIEDQPIAIQLAASDIDGDSLAYTWSVPAGFPGTLSGSAPSLVFTPTPDFSGTASFDFTATDPAGLAATSQVQIVVQAANDAPVAGNARASTRQGTPLTLPLPVSDADGDQLTFTITSYPLHGSMVIADGKAIYMPNAGFSGVDRFRYTAHDIEAASAPADVIIRVAGNPTVAVVSPASGARITGSQAITVKVEASDPDSDLSFVELLLDGTRVGSGTTGTLQVALENLPGGQHTLTATAVDADGGRTVSQPVSFSVEKVNRAPVVAAGADRATTLDSLGPNLIVNPGNEEALVNGAIPGWSAVGSATWGQGKADSRKRDYSFTTANIYPAASEGAVYFQVPGDQTAELSQDIELTESQRSAVALGAARFAFEARSFTYQPKQPLPQDYTGRPSAEVPTGELDRPEAVVEFYNASGQLLASHAAAASLIGDRWLKFGTGALVPASTTRARIRLIATKADTKDQSAVVFVGMTPADKNDALFDAVSFRLGAPADEFLSAAVSDDGLPAGSTLVKLWSQVSGPSAVIAEPDKATTSVNFSAPGDYEFRMEADDSELASSDTVTVHVQRPIPNLPPVVAAGADLTTDFQNKSIALLGTVSDETATADLAIGWTQVSGPGKVSFADPLSASTTISVSLPGTYVLKLAAFDGEWSSEDLVVVEATATAQRRPLDLVLTMDHSGSMWALKNDGDPSLPITKAREAAAMVLSKLDPATDRAAMRKFNGPMVTPLTFDLTLVKQSLVQSRGEPGTEGSFQPSNIDNGIQGALNHVLATPRSGAPDRVILVFNDGAGPYSDVAAKAARAAGVRVIVVSFSNGIDAIDDANMRLQASAPGDFISAETPAEAVVLLNNLLETLRLPLNSPPQVNAGTATRLSNTSGQAFLDGTFTDDGEPGLVAPAILWEQVSGPASATLSDPHKLDPRVTFTTAGEYRFKLSVSDGERTGSDTVLVQVDHPVGLPAPSGITSWWPFDGNLRDMVGGRHLSRSGFWDSPRFTTGVLNDAVQLLDSPDVLAGGTAGEIGLNSSTGFSIELRFRARSLTGGYLVSLFNPATGALNGISWGRPGSTSSSGQLYFLSPPATANSVYGDVALTTTALTTNAWHHAVLTHNRSNNETWLYLNGQGQRVFTAPFGPFFSTAGQLTIGGMPATPGFSPATAKDAYRRFDGDIDDLAFYDRPLSMGEAGQLYQSSSTGKQPPTLDRAPVVDAGIDLRVSNLAASLNGLVSDDTTDVKSAWSQVSGPGTATFADASSPDTTVTFSVAGIYTLKLTATDATTSASDLMQVHAGLPTATAAPDGLVAWMPGNRHPVDVITGRTGIWSGTELYAPVKAGDGFQFGGSVSRVRYLPPAVAPADSGRGFSIETWMSLPTPLAPAGANVLSFQNVSGINVHRLQLAEFTLPSGAKEAGFFWRTSSPAFGAVNDIQVRPLPLGRPFHLALTYDPVTLRKKAFIDGVLVTDSTAPAGTVHHFDKECFVGSFPGETPVFPGQVDELSLYNVALTQPQILAIVQAGDSGKYLAPPAADPRVDAGPDVALAPGESHTFAPAIDTAAFSGGSLTTTWTKVSGPGSVAFNQASRPDAIITVSQAGRHVVRLTVTNGTTTVSDEVTIDVVTLPNAAPVITSLPASVSLQLPAGQADFAPQVTDDGRPTGLLEHRWIVLDGPAPVTFTPTSGMGTQATFTTAGDYTLVLEVSDGLATTRREIPVQVAAAPLPPTPNQAPVVSAGTDFEANAASFSLEGTVTDDGKPSAQPVIQAWSLVSGPGDVVFASPSALSTAVTVDIPGTYRLRLSASDGELVGFDDVIVIVPATATGFPNKTPRVALPSFLAGNLPNLNATLQPAVEDDGRSGSPLTYAWVQLDGPVAAEIATPTEATTSIHFTVEGEYLFELVVSDGEFSAVARTTIQVNPSNNHAPVVTMTPAAPARPYDQATLAATVSDDGNPSNNLTYHWNQIAGPEEVVIANPHALETPVTFGAGGSYLFELLVSDGQLSTRETVVWDVIGVPDVRVISPEADALLPASTLMTLQGRAQIDGGTITSLSFEVDGVVLGQGDQIPVTVDWTLTVPSLAPGEHTIVARTTSSDGQQAASTPQLFTVGEQRVDDFLVEIASPGDGDSITGPVEVSGTVQARRLTSWTLTLTPTVPEGAPVTGTSVVIASGTQPVNQEVLGSIDPTLMLNGVYTLKLSATTQFGSTSSDSIPILFEGNRKIGHFSLAFEDLSIPVGGVPLTVTRTYDSRDSGAGDFGPGWSVGFSSVKVRKAGRLGEGWEQDQTISGITPIYSVFPTTKKRVVVTFPGGKTETFEPVFRASSPLSEDQQNYQKFAEISEGTIVFKAINGSEGTLQVEGDPSVIWNGPVPGHGTVIDFTFGPIDPKRFRYTAADGTAYVIDEIQGLVSLEDPNGNTLTINRSGLVHSSGESVLFTRNGTGRITEVTDPAGEKILYGYDTAGRLQSVTDRTGEVTSFHYEDTAFPNYLTRITDPRGVDAIRTEFDDDGRMVRQIDAAGNAVEFEHDLADNREIIRDRLGNVTIHEYDDRGNILKTTDALDGVTSYTYDANDNETSVASPLGLVTSRTYDSNNNLLTETDPAGHASTYTYDAKRRPLTSADALGHTTSLEYDGVGNLIHMTDPGNAVTTIHYDGNGNVSGVVDATGRGNGSTYDSKGREISDSDGNHFVYDAAGNRTQTFRYRDGHPNEQIITTYEYDTAGRLTRTILPGGSTSETVYNAIGKPAKTIDAAGRETVYVYDALGHLVSTTYPDGTVTSAAYDIEGRQTATTDAAGVTTYTLYDALGRATTTILPDATMPPTILSEVADIAAAPALADNPRRTTTYDADGRVVASTDENGQATTFEYDDAGRRTAVVNALGQRTTTTYDDAGRQTSVTDAKGITTGFEYDAAGRLTRTNFADSTYTQTTYDAAGRRILATDQAGNTTEYGYTDRGQLNYVIDAEGFYTEYEYDSQSRQIGQSTPLAYTQYRYDDLGRRIARIMPDGHQEHFGYDTLGRLVQHQDFNGHVTTREYDSLNDHLLAVIADANHPSLALDHAPARHEFSYDVLGRRTNATVKNAAGTVLHTDSWSYDLQSRPLVQASTTGTLRYAWDATGTLAGVKSDTPGGYDLSYDYDELGRLTTVHEGQEGVDPAARAIAGYAYDANGNLAGTSYLNQVTHAYAYNSLNRLTNLSIDRQPGGSGAVAAPLQGYTYTLNAAGHRTGISELGGRTVVNTFDRLYRLVHEDISHTEGENVDTPLGTIGYTYDPVGNRQIRYPMDRNWVAGRSISSLVPEQYREGAYNERDQYIGDSYDANGNTTVSDTKGPNGWPVSATDLYSFDNRLIRRTRGDGLAVDILYNTDGDRVAKWVKQDNLNLSITRYLVDRANPTGYSQVVEEKDGTGQLTACYLYGHDLIAFDNWITRVSGIPQRLTTPERRWYQYDGLGSVRGLSNDDGTLVEEYTYEAFGTLIGLRQLDPTSGQLVPQDPLALENRTANRYLFTGEQWDSDLGMYFLRARYLNPDTGRFHTEDLYEGSQTEPLSLHKYLYTHADPINGIDPSGHMLVDISAAQSSQTMLGRLDSMRVRLHGFALQGQIQAIRILLHGRYLMFMMAINMPTWLDKLEKANNIVTIGTGGLLILSETMERMAASSANSGSIPPYPIQDRGRGGEAAAGANLGGNVSRIDHYDRNSNIGVQVFTSSGSTEASILSGIRSKLGSLRDAEQGAIYGTTSDGESFRLKEATMPSGSIGLLVQVDIATASVVQSSGFSQRLSELSREFGRLIRIAPVRLR